MLFASIFLHVCSSDSLLEFCFYVKGLDEIYFIRNNSLSMLLRFSVVNRTLMDILNVFYVYLMLGLLVIQLN